MAKDKSEKKPFQRDYERDPNAQPLSAEQIRNQFGLTYNEEHVGGRKTHPNGSNNTTGAVYNRETGEYIGTLSNFKDADYGKFEDMRSFAKESGLMTGDVNGMDSLNDVATMASQMHAGTMPNQGFSEPGPEITESKTLSDAKERAQSWIEGADERSDKIFGGNRYGTGERAMAKEQLDLGADDPYQSKLL